MTNPTFVAARDAPIAPRASNSCGSPFRGRLIRKNQESGTTVITRAKTGKGSRGSAAILADHDISHLLNYIDSNSNYPEADRVKFLLSFHAGMRVGEIAALRVSDVMDATGATGTTVRVRASTAKYNKAREIPLTQELRQAIDAFRQKYPDQERFAIAGKWPTKHREQTAKALAGYFRHMYHRAGFKKCSSHSGRRTFATILAREHNEAGRSLKDVQKLMGHARLDTTERYIECSKNLEPLIDIISRRLGSG